MRYIIPTYHRSDYMTTARLLVEQYGIDPSDITICLQDRDDVYAYADTGVIPKGCEVLINLDAHNAGSNRNTGLREHLGEMCLLLDDDLRCLSIRNPLIEPEELIDPAPHRGKGVRQQKISALGFERLLHDWSEILSKDLGTIVSLNVNDNSGHLSYLDYEHRFRTNGSLIGQCVMLIADEELLFDEDISYGEDIELGMRNVSIGGVTVRDTAWMVGTRNRVASSDKDVPGGIIEVLSQKDEMLSRVASMYPDLITFREGWNLPRTNRGVMGYLDDVPMDLLAPFSEEYLIPKNDERYWR